MSRIGKNPISVPAGVTVTVSNENLVTVKGPKGELTQQVDAEISVKQEDNVLTVSRPTDQKRHKALHGLYRSLINNMVIGVTEGFGPLTLLLTAFAYPTVIMLCFTIYKWYDDQWKISLWVKIAGSITCALIITFFAAIALLIEPWEIGGTLLVVFVLSIISFFVIPSLSKKYPLLVKFLSIFVFL